MKEPYLLLAARVRAEMADIENAVERVERAMQGSRTSQDEQDIYLDSVALNLHDFYSGVERVLQRIAQVVDRSVPTGDDWHAELLRQMTTRVPGVRPAVLRQETGSALLEYLRFRHVVRNVYSFHFDPQRLSTLVGRLRPALDLARDDLGGFAETLEEIAGSE
jgi:hypothetical protein